LKNGNYRQMSACVKTVTSAGQQDGGILVDKVNGHLNDAHKVATAQRLSFFERPANATDLPKKSAG